MFRSASQIDSERTASSLRRIKANWERTADNWFTGSVDSIDRRIALCERLIHQASQATGRLLDRPESGHYMKLANDLRADHEALTQMRRDLLTAAVDREAGHNIGGIPDEYNDDYGPLPDQDELRRQVYEDEHSGDDEPPTPQQILEFWERDAQDPWRHPRPKQGRTAGTSQQVYKQRLRNEAYQKQLKDTAVQSFMDWRDQQHPADLRGRTADDLLDMFHDDMLGTAEYQGLFNDDDQRDAIYDFLNTKYPNRRP